MTSEPAWPRPPATSRVALRDGRYVRVRPSRRDDVSRLLELHAALSPATRHSRYFTAGGTKRRSDAQRLAAADGTAEIVLVATTDDGTEIVAVGELARFGDRAEVALVVRDDYQDVGLGGVLFPRLLDLGAEEGIRTVEVALLSGNNRILRIVHRHTPRLQRPENGVVLATIDLDAPAGMAAQRDRGDSGAAGVRGRKVFPAA